MKNLFQFFVRISVFALLLLVQPVWARQSAALAQPLAPLERLLNADGTLNLQTGFNGSLDATGWTMVNDAGGRPRFVRSNEKTGEVPPLKPNAVPDSMASLTGTNGPVRAIAASASDVYVGGFFTTAGGVSANRIARWDGSTWSALDSGVSDQVLAIAVSGSDIYVGGTFTSAGGVSANRIAKWNGSTWSALGSGVSDTVRAIAVNGSDVYAGGDFTTAGGVSAKNIARWNGSTWSALGNGPINVYALAASGSDVYVGGSFNFITPSGDRARFIARWDGSNWSALGSGIDDGGSVFAIAVSGSDVYAGGAFRKVGGISADRIARWDGSTWSALGIGVDNDTLNAVAVRGNDVYLGGYFTSVSGADVKYFAMWTTAVKVVAEANYAVSDAEVYRNETLAGLTDSIGALNIPDLKIGDKLVARRRILEQPSPRGAHNQDSTQNWAYRVYLTSLDIPQTGEPVPFVVSVTDVPALTLKKGNVLIGFNVVASIEWDANTTYVEQLRQGFRLASAYLYDASDGQMLFERVTVYDNAQNWDEADYQIYASNQVWPAASAAELRINDQGHIQFGRFFDGSSSNQGAWTAANAFRTFIHEFGHHGLNLYDSYLYYETDANGKVEKKPGVCTSPAIRTNNLDAVNATLMDFQYNATEFSAQGVAGLWSEQCKKTQQWDAHGKSDWETFAPVFGDANNPARWQIQTPGTRGSVAVGPTVIPIGSWASSTIGNNANTGICAMPPTYQATFSGNPVGEATALLKKNGRTISQGATDANGNITVLGAANGDVVAFMKPVDITGEQQVSCTAGPSPQNATGIAVNLQPAAFTLDISTRPGSSANGVSITVKSSATLSAPPSVSLYQPGAASPIAVAMSFDSGSGTYVGSAALNANLGLRGNLAVSATDTQGNKVETFTTFNLTPVSRNQTMTVRSADGLAELYIPAGALSADGRINIAPDQSPGALPSGMVAISGPYRINADSGLSLSAQANLTLHYLNTGGTLSRVNLSTAQVYRWDGTQWTALDSTSVNNTSKSASISSFGTYAVLARQVNSVYLPIIIR